ncbi:hypothetical protein GUITHDRAFT_112954 [Guillardia theta CCMP2712]|uniref:EF-hand domain-containing protein n=3 Tax=Guillardia theta TaxID=55529 RepID=L1IYH1_GUITC|nr:hypothetical protein GUITHDRAFT_112954 [Guillardia theta CCMP2712]EKX40949.1 hypothetical protein GUITHDRAFT_112954 [Guillardia theta CCMP2712]|eukprot:XP_005827929.1 hypothetical protein GUITHDRAFT_112954 [Guillardia theta CCMP2712]
MQWCRFPPFDVWPPLRASAMQSSSSKLLEKHKQVVDDCQSSQEAQRVLRSLMHDYWAEANRPKRVQPLCKDGLVELCVYVLDTYLTSSLDDIRRYTCGALYNISRQLPSSRVVRQRMLSAGAYPMLPKLLVSDLWKVRFYGTLITAHCGLAGLTSQQRVVCSLESIGWLCECLEKTLGGEGFGGGLWSIEEVMAGAASLCSLPDNCEGFLAANGAKLTLEALRVVTERQGSEYTDELRAITMTMARISCDGRFKSSCSPSAVEILEQLMSSEIVAVKSNVMSVLANIGSEKASLEEAFKQACASSSAKWNRSQLSVVGKGRVGKTAFVRAVLQKPFEHTESTIGMEGMTCEVSSVLSGKMWWKEQSNAHSELEMLQARQAAAIAKGIQMVESDVLQGLESSLERGRVEGEEEGEEEETTGREKAGGPEGESTGGASDEPSVVSEPVMSKYNQDLVVECLQDEGMEESVVFELWDYGGQDVFYALFHLFITRYGMFAVLFNMEELMSGDTAVRAECLDFIEFWLSTIYLHTSQASSESCSPILIVGTHKDKVSNPLHHLFISRILDDKFRDHIAWPHVQVYQQNDSLFAPSIAEDTELLMKKLFHSMDLDQSSTLEPSEVEACFGADADPSLVQQFFSFIDLDRDGKISFTDFRAACTQALSFFPVDNTLGHVDPVIPHILSVIEKIALNSDYIQQRVPFAWIKCLDSIKQTGQDVLLLSQVEKIASECGLPLSRKLGLSREVCGMLEHFHHLGKLMHHNETSLRDFVIARPVDFLIRPATQVVCEHDLHRTAQQTEARRLTREWKSLTQQAVLSKKLLPILWKEYQDRSALLEHLCVKFGIFIPLKPEQSDEAMSFLVPTLLREETLSPVADGVLNCFLLFSSDPDFLQQEQRGVWRREDLAGRFVPNSLFGSVIGQAIAWSQSTGGAQQKLSKTEAMMAFGKHKFLLQELKEEKCFRLVIFVQNPKNILARLTSIVQNVLDKTMPRLRCYTALSFASGGGDRFFLDYQVVCDKVREQEGMWIGSDHVEWTELRKELGEWLPSNALLSSYDVFFSYRQGDFDSEVVQKVYDILSYDVVGEEGRRLEIFYDQVRLKAGRRFDLDFMKAMACTSLAVPLVSSHALARMFSLNEGSAEDHVLMEWCLILELQLSGQLRSCLPVIIGPVSSDLDRDPIGNFFADDPLARLPDIVPRRTVEEVKKFMSNNNLVPSAQLEERTVRSIVKELTKNLAVLTWTLADSHGQSVLPRSDTHARELFGLFEQVAKSVIKAYEAIPVQPQVGKTGGDRGLPALEVDEGSTPGDTRLKAKEPSVQELMEEINRLKANQVQQAQSGCCSLM